MSDKFKDLPSMAFWNCADSWSIRTHVLRVHYFIAECPGILIMCLKEEFSYDLIFIQTVMAQAELLCNYNWQFWDRQSACCTIFIPQVPSTWLKTSIQPYFGWLYNSYVSWLLAGYVMSTFMCLTINWLKNSASSYSVSIPMCQACDVRTRKRSGSLMGKINSHYCVTHCHSHFSYAICFNLRTATLIPIAGP